MSAAVNYVGSYRVSRVVRPGRSIQLIEAVDDLGQRCFVKSVASGAENRAAAAELRQEHEVAGSFEIQYTTRVGPLERSHGCYVLLEFQPCGQVATLNNLSRDLLEQWLPRIVLHGGAALSYLHMEGWVHGALKPSSLLVDGSGSTWLTDFGHAQAVKPSFFHRLLRRGSRAIHAPAYAAPEQIRGELLDERADIYSFGCLLFQLFSGKPPYSGTTPNELLHKHLKAPIPPLRSRPAGVTPEVSELVHQLLAKSREERPASMDDVLRRLQSCRLFREAS